LIIYVRMTCEGALRESVTMIRSSGNGVIPGRAHRVGVLVDDLGLAAARAQGVPYLGGDGPSP